MSDQQVHVSLREEQDRLWRLFHSHKNEMIVNKQGRKMFPKLEYVVRGLTPDKLYAMMLHIEQSDENRYKFSRGEWIKSGKGEQHKDPKNIWHADGVRSGKDWMANPICFDRVKITNNADSTNASMIFLHSMHKYIPVLTIYESPSDSPFSALPSTRLVTSVRLIYTEFIAVTAYQNDAVNNLKIKFNPFAKGFREGSQRDRKRNSPSADDSTTDESQNSQVSSPKPKKSCPVSTSPPPLVTHLPSAPTVFNLSLINPLFYNLPYFSHLTQGTPPPTPFPFSLGFPYFSPLSFTPPSQSNKTEQKEEDEEEIEPEINVV